MEILENWKDLWERFGKLRVLVIGDLMLDRYIFGDANRISPEAPVPVVDVEYEREALGAAANVALNLRSMGVEVEVLGTFGLDASGERLKHLFSTHSIGFDLSCQRREIQTITKTRIIVRNQQLCRLDVEDLPGKYTLEQYPHWERLLENIHRYGAIIFSNYAKGTLTQSIVDRVLGVAKRHGVIVAADPKPRDGIQFFQVDLLKPNRAEAFEMLGMENMPVGANWQEVCECIFRRSASKNLVITLGQGGMLVAVDGKVQAQIASDAHEVFDVSGAGDTAIAFLTMALGVGESVVDAVKLANIASGIVVSKVGTATVTEREILNRMRYNKI